MSTSFTIWYEKRQASMPDPKVDLHINLWINIGNKDQLDFGLMISEPQSIKEIFFYLPFFIEKNEITNLMEVLSVNKDISDLVFNGDLGLGTKTGEIQKVTRDGKEFQYYLVGYMLLNKLDGLDLSNGSIIKYTFDDKLESTPVYLRFRINDIRKKGIIEHQPKTASYLTG